MELLLLTLTICSFALYAWLFIETQVRDVLLTKFDKNNYPMKTYFLINLNILYYIIFLHQILMNVFNIINISRIIIDPKIIDISIKSCFLSYYLLTSLLKYFLSITDVLQFQNLLLSIYKFLYPWQTNNCFLRYNASWKRIYFLLQ